MTVLTVQPVRKQHQKKLKKCSQQLLWFNHSVAGKRFDKYFYTAQFLYRQITCITVKEVALFTRQFTVTATMLQYSF